MARYALNSRKTDSGSRYRYLLCESTSRVPQSMQCPLSHNYCTRRSTFLLQYVSGLWSPLCSVEIYIGRGHNPSYMHPATLVPARTSIVFCKAASNATCSNPFKRATEGTAITSGPMQSETATSAFRLDFMLFPKCRRIIVPLLKTSIEDLY